MGRVIRWGTGMYKWEDQHGSLVKATDTKSTELDPLAIGAFQPFYFMIKTYKSYKIDIDPPIVYISLGQEGRFCKIV